MKRPYQHCPRAAASRSARTSNTASSGSDGGAARPCTPTPTPPFDTRAPGVAFGPPWAATRAATRDDFFMNAHERAWLATSEHGVAKGELATRERGLIASGARHRGLQEGARPAESVGRLLERCA
eukprot:scaffold36860_cov67-Phaeocystis_antarctica.AAC.1